MSKSKKLYGKADAWRSAPGVWFPAVRLYVAPISYGEWSDMPLVEWNGFPQKRRRDAVADLPDLIAFAETQADRNGYTIEWEGGR